MSLLENSDDNGDDADAEPDWKMKVGDSHQLSGGPARSVPRRKKTDQKPDDPHAGTDWTVEDPDTGAKVSGGPAKVKSKKTVKEGEHSDFSGAGLADQGPNSNRDFEKDDNRQSSAGEHHTGGGKAKASTPHMGGNSAALPLEEAHYNDLVEKLTRRIAARLLDTRRR